MSWHSVGETPSTYPFFFQRNVFKSSFTQVSGDESMKLPPLFRVQISLWGLSLSWSYYCHCNTFIRLLLHEGKRRLVLLAKCSLRVTLNTGGHLTIAAWGGWLYAHFGSRRIEALRWCEGSGMPWGGLWRESFLIFACIQVSGVILSSKAIQDRSSRLLCSQAYSFQQQASHLLVVFFLSWLLTKTSLMLCLFVHFMAK